MSTSMILDLHGRTASFARKMGDEARRNPAHTPDSRAEMLGMEAAFTRESEVIILDPDAGRLLGALAEQFPTDYELQESDVSYRHTVLWFEEIPEIPVTSQTLATLFKTDPERNLQGIALPVIQWSTGQSVNVCPLIMMPERHNAMNAWSIPWGFGRSIDVLVERSQNPIRPTLEIAGADIDILRLTGAFLLLRRQGLLEEEKLPIPRQLRRRLERDRITFTETALYLHLPAGHPAPERRGGDVEWSRRWLVRGHWRNQWYPSEQVHRTIWISPYVKGPEDRPFIG